MQPDRVAREFKRRLGDRVPLLLGGEEFTAEQLNMYLGLDRPGQAVDLLRRTEQEVREPAARAELAALRAVMLAVEGDWAAYDEAIASVEATGEPGAYATTVALYARAVRQFHLARGPEALALNEQALSMLPDEGNAWFRAGLVSWRCVMQTYFGCSSEAAASATAGYEQARSVGWRGEAGAWLMWLGRVAARQGRLRSAGRHFNEAAIVLCEDNTWGHTANSYGEWSTVEALLGDVPRAQELLHRALLDLRSRTGAFTCWHSGPLSRGSSSPRAALAMPSTGRWDRPTRPVANSCCCGRPSSCTCRFASASPGRRSPAWRRSPRRPTHGTSARTRSTRKPWCDAMRMLSTRSAPRSPTSAWCCTPRRSPRRLPWCGTAPVELRAAGEQRSGPTSSPSAARVR